MHAGGAITTGSDNTFLGYHCGYGAGVEVNEQSQVDEQLVLIGKYCTRDSSVGQATAITNSIGIGYNVKVSASNQVILGNENITSTILRGAITVGSLAGIGTRALYVDENGVLTV
jgi:acetyltransferase-like isoleucine patch superfamily enzyme